MVAHAKVKVPKQKNKRASVVWVDEEGEFLTRVEGGGGEFACSSTGCRYVLGLALPKWCLLSCDDHDK